MPFNDSFTDQSFNPPLESQFSTTLAPPDVIFELTASYKADKDPNKINLGVGAYRDNQGNPWTLPVVKKVRLKILNS